MDRERMALRDKAVNYRSASGRPPGWPRSRRSPSAPQAWQEAPGTSRDRQLLKWKHSSAFPGQREQTPGPSSELQVQQSRVAPESAFLASSWVLFGSMIWKRGRHLHSGAPGHCHLTGRGGQIPA